MLTACHGLSQTIKMANKALKWLHERKPCECEACNLPGLEHPWKTSHVSVMGTSIPLATALQSICANLVTVHNRIEAACGSLSSADRSLTAPPPLHPAAPGSLLEQRNQ